MLNTPFTEWPLYSEEEGDIVFLHCLEEGGADRSYGINVAQMAGMPRDVVNRAKDILIRLEKDHYLPL